MSSADFCKECGYDFEDYRHNYWCSKYEAQRVAKEKGKERWTRHPERWRKSRHKVNRGADSFNTTYYYPRSVRDGSGRF